jgi:hypothetical protein
MTDRDVDDRLRADGDQWRAAQAPPPEPDVERLLAAGPGPARRWLPFAAAAAVLALVAGAVTIASLGGSSDNDRVSPATHGTTSLVHAGDLAAGQGLVLALPGRPVQLCPPGDVVQISIYPPPVPRPCEVGVTVVGLDLDRLAHREERDGAVWGHAEVEGVYRAGTLTITRQEVPADPPRDDATAPDAVPCPEPPGGWPRQPPEPTLEPLRNRLRQVIHQHPTLFNDLQIRYPYGWHLQDTSNRKGTEVYVVGTVGDVAEGRRILAAAEFPAAHLCVTQVTWSMADMKAAETQLRSAQARRAGVSSARAEVLTDQVVAELVVLDEAASSFLATVAGGRVVANPMLRRVG